jgi:hypothetical protein
MQGCGVEEQVTNSRLEVLTVGRVGVDLYPEQSGVPVTALAHPDVNGVLGSPDVVEELLLLGALDGKVVIGSMNRGGLDGAVWTLDDRFTGYDAARTMTTRGRRPPCSRAPRPSPNWPGAA